MVKYKLKIKSYLHTYMCVDIVIGNMCTGLD